MDAEHPHPPTRLVPAGSTAARELIGVVIAALNVPPPRRRSDETACLLLTRQRSLMVTESLARLRRAGAGLDDEDIMREAGIIAAGTAGMPARYPAAGNGGGS